MENSPPHQRISENLFDLLLSDGLPGQKMVRFWAGKTWVDVPLKAVTKEVGKRKGKVTKEVGTRERVGQVKGGGADIVLLQYFLAISPPRLTMGDCL